MIAVDANILAYYFIESSFTQLAHQVFAKDQQWVVPQITSSSTSFNPVYGKFSEKNINIIR